MISIITQRMKKAKGDEGFTLIELLVVVIILGILAAIVVFSISGLNEDSQDSACKIDARTVRTAQEAYFATNGNYAANMAALVPDFLAEPSTLHDTAASGSTYTISNLGDCIP